MLSEEELILVRNSDWILTKNRIIEKIISVFADLSEYSKSLVNKYESLLPEETSRIPPKISRGEQHHGLPYVILDYPRLFSREDVFAIRTFFWWGKFFSLTLHLKGKYLALFENALYSNAEKLSGKGFHVSISDDEWRQDFDPDNYSPVSISEEIIKANNSEQKFLKLAVNWPLDNTITVIPLIEETYEFLMGVLTKVNYPDDGIIP